MNPQPDPPHGQQAGEDAEAHARLLADASHEHEVLQKILFLGSMGVIAIIAAFFTTILDLTIFWRNVWLTITIIFAVLMFAGVFRFCANIDTSTSPEAKH